MTERKHKLDTSKNVGSFAGIRVLEIANMIVGPLAGQMLGDMGADVVKVEPPEGDLMRRIGKGHSPDMGAFFLGSNRNKRSIVLDIKKSEARPALERLIAQSDVLLTSMRGDAIKRLKLDYKSLTKINPKIILCHVKGFADEGVYGGKPAYDDVAQAVSGLAMIQRAVTGGVPRYVPSIIGDKITAVHAAFAMAAAIHHCAQTGHGQEISVPMFETMVAFNMIEHLWGETHQPALATMGYPPISTASRRPFKTKDGYICVMPYTDQHWANLCHAIGDTELAEDARFKTHAARQKDQPAFWNQVADVATRRTTAEWYDILAKADVPFAPVNSLEDLLTDPHLDSVDFWQIYEHPSEGALRMTKNPMAMSDSPATLRRLAPRLGEHSEEILRDLAFTSDDISSLSAKGILGRPPAAKG